MSDNTVAEAKLTIKELRCKKREYMIQKKELSFQIAQSRQNTRNMIILMGKDSRRGMQAACNIGIMKFQTKKSKIEEQMMEIDQFIIYLQRQTNR